jgi:hypothetical protein
LQWAGLDRAFVIRSVCRSVKAPNGALAAPYQNDFGSDLLSRRNSPMFRVHR